MTARDGQVRDALAWLERRGSERVREEMLTRYGIRTPQAYGVKVGVIQQLARLLGRDHELAAALWDTGWYEARILAAYVGEPERLTAAQMDRWTRDFDNWGICDTLCFCLYDRTPHAWGKVGPWSRRRDEFVRRAGFALLACLALHDRSSGDSAFVKSLRLIETGAADGRNFVKKGMLWALRAIGMRNASLNAAAVVTAQRLAASPDESERWLGRTALRELTSPALKKRLARKAPAQKKGGKR